MWIEAIVLGIVIVFNLLLLIISSALDFFLIVSDTIRSVINKIYGLLKKIYYE